MIRKKITQLSVLFAATLFSSFPLHSSEMPFKKMGAAALRSGSVDRAKTTRNNDGIHFGPGPGRVIEIDIQRGLDGAPTASIHFGPGPGGVQMVESDVFHYLIR